MCIVKKYMNKRTKTRFKKYDYFAMTFSKAFRLVFANVPISSNSFRENSYETKTF